jgi:hypothetical protein
MNTYRVRRRRQLPGANDRRDGPGHCGSQHRRGHCQRLAELPDLVVGNRKRDLRLRERATRQPYGGREPRCTDGPYYKQLAGESCLAQMPRKERSRR